MFAALALGIAALSGIACNGASIVVEGQPLPLWSFVCSLIHCGVVIPGLGVMVAARHGFWLNGNFSEWMEAPWTDGCWAEQAVFCGIIGAMLRDFLTNDVTLTPFALGMMVHHFATVAGCTMCCLSPLGMGIVTLNAVQAEAGSALYGLVSMKSRINNVAVHNAFDLIYWIGMSASNVSAIWIAYWYVSLDVPENLKILYFRLTILLVFLRQGVCCKMMGEAAIARLTKRKTL